MNVYFQDESTENGPDPGAPFDPDTDAQLDSLREKLTEVIRMLIAKFFLLQNCSCLIYLRNDYAVRWRRILKC